MDNPALNPTRLISTCCNATIWSMPPSLGQPRFHFCSNCKVTLDDSTMKSVLIYEKISNGIYRIIKY